MIALSMALVSQVYANNKTNTNTIFGEEGSASSDKYGNTVYERDVTIKTTNFKVKNFWSRFSDANQAQSEYTNISKIGTLRIVMEATSACTLDNTLPKEGCSGQKPFLINDEVLNNPLSGTTDEYEVAFSLASEYGNTENQTFYPLDILRDAQYYKDPYPGDTSTSVNRGFFGFFTSAFDFIFSKTIGFGKDFFGNPDIADVKYTPRSDDAEDRRQRYIANIIAGVEKAHRMTKEVEGSTATQIDALTKLNTPVSLLHYAEASKTTETDQCKFMFLNLSADGLMCRMMSGFGMDAWMPFFTKTKTTKIETNLIMGDTENALLAMTGKIENVPYMQDVGGSENDKLSFLQEMLKPMETMIDFMKTMLFGSVKKENVEKTVERVYSFNENDAMTLSMAVTNSGVEVDDFANFKLLKIRSVYGDMMNSCTVKYSGMMGFGSWTKTFTEGGTQSVDSPDSSFMHHETWNDDQWISWCQEASGTKGIFDVLFDWSSGGVLNPLNWMSAMFSMFSSSYTVKDFTNTIKRGLILDLKKVDLDPISARNTRKIEIKQIQ